MLTFWGPRVVVVVVVLLSIVSLEETSEVSEFILKTKKKGKKKRKRTCDCDKHEKSMVQARFVMVETRLAHHRFFPGSLPAGTCR